MNAAFARASSLLAANDPMVRATVAPRWVRNRFGERILLRVPYRSIGRRVVTSDLMKRSAQPGKEENVRDDVSLLSAFVVNMRRPRVAAATTELQAVVPPDVGALFSAHAPFLMRVVERLTGPGAHVEDLVQDVFMVAHRRSHELRDGPELRGWLYRVASHAAMQHRRALWRRFRLMRAVSTEPTGHHTANADDVVDRRERGLHIRRVVLELPFLHREVFVLSELEELDTRTIAMLLAVPEGTVASRLHTARRLFRERFSADGAGG